MHTIHTRAGCYDVHVHYNADCSGDVVIAWGVPGAMTPRETAIPADHLTLTRSDGMEYLAVGNNDYVDGYIDSFGDLIPSCVLIAATLVLQKERIRSELIQTLEVI